MSKQKIQCKCGNGKCPLCLDKLFEEKEKQKEIRAVKCKNSQNHIPQSVIQFEQQNKQLFDIAYNGKSGEPERVVGGPEVFRCQHCHVEMDFYLLKWKNSIDNFPWGKGVTLVWVAYIVSLCFIFYF